MAASIKDLTTKEVDELNREHLKTIETRLTGIDDRFDTLERFFKKWCYYRNFV